MTQQELEEQLRDVVHKAHESGMDNVSVMTALEDVKLMLMFAQFQAWHRALERSSSNRPS